MTNMQKKLISNTKIAHNLLLVNTLLCIYKHTYINLIYHQKATLSSINISAIAYVM